MTIRTNTIGRGTINFFLTSQIDPTSINPPIRMTRHLLANGNTFFVQQGRSTLEHAMLDGHIDFYRNPLNFGDSLSFAPEHGFPEFLGVTEETGANPHCS